jgi:hypothetical protein
MQIACAMWSPGARRACRASLRARDVVGMAMMLALLFACICTNCMYVGAISHRPDLNDCFEMLEGAEPPVFCAASTPREFDSCFLQCGFCTVPTLRSGMSASDRATYCDKNHSNLDFDREKVGALAANALINVSAAHGYFWARPESNSTAALTHILSYMGRADLQVLFTQPFLMLDYLHEHVTYATAARGGGILTNVTDELWLEYVVPFGFMDEKRDLFWRWRPTFHRTFSTSEEVRHAIPSAYGKILRKYKPALQLCTSHTWCV